MITSGIASGIAISALYALSGAGLISSLPLLRPALALCAAVYILRGVCGIPVVFLASGPYARELRERTMFMVVTSFVSCAIGACYTLGLVRNDYSTPLP